MFKLILFILNICLVSSITLANDESLVSLFEDDPSFQKNNTKKQEGQEKQEKKEGFLSFMNLEIPDKIFTSEKEAGTTIEDVINLANKGDLQSQLALGYAYLYGKDGLKINYDKAFEYYGKAALQNDPVGLNNLGSLFYGGIGTPRDVVKAAILFKKAAELGNIDAAVNIGFMLASGNGAKKDIEQALKYFETAASGNIPAAKFMVGYAYYKGLYRDLNYSKAAPLLKEAADAGFDEAQAVVANIYMNGLGFPQNYNNGVKYLESSIAQGNTGAMIYLADILVEGKKYNKDIPYAHVLYNLASVRGVASAVRKRSHVETMMKIDEILLAQQRAEKFKEQLSPTTSYIRQTYGKNIASYFQEE